MKSVFWRDCVDENDYEDYEERCWCEGCGFWWEKQGGEFWFVGEQWLVIGIGGVSVGKEGGDLFCCCC